MRIKKYNINQYIKYGRDKPFYFQPAEPDGEKIDMSRFRLTFADEFDGQEIDHSVWSSEKGISTTSVRHGSYWNTDMAVIKDGNLLYINHA